MTVRTMFTFKDFGLKDDPFATTPPKDMVWADRERFVTQLKDAMRRSLSSSPSRIIACIWGDWGAGKTHAMYYFSQPTVMQDIVDELDLDKQRPPISIPVVFPLGNVADTIYLEIVEQIGVERIVKALHSLEPENEGIRPMKSFQDKLYRIMDPRVADVFAALKGKNPFLFKRYISMTATSAELKNSGVTRGIETSSDKTRIMSGILNLLTNTIASRVFIWFDDLERLGDSPGKEVYGFQYLIRDLLDNVPNNLVMLFNMTMLPGEKVEERLFYLGDAIRYRISDKITVEPFTKEEFLSYVRDLLCFHRLEPVEEESFFPFEEPGLNFMFSELKRRGVPLEPRNVNEALSSALFEACKDTEKTDPSIDKSYLERHINEILSRLSLPRILKT